MINPKRDCVTIPLTDDDLRMMVDNHLLTEDEIDDRKKIARVVRKLLDRALGLPEKPLSLPKISSGLWVLTV